MNSATADLKPSPAIAELDALSAVGWSDLFGVIERLSPRQIEVMLMLDDGMSMAEISRKLKVTQPRVRQLRDVLARKVIRARRIVAGEETIKAMTQNVKVSDGGGL